MLRQQRIRRKRQALFLSAFVLIFLLGIGLGTVFAHAEEPAAGHAHKYYTNVELQAGDTLWQIADTYMDAHYADRRELLNELMELNHLTSDRLISGQKLIVPYYVYD